MNINTEGANTLISEFGPYWAVEPNALASLTSRIATHNGQPQAATRSPVPATARGGRGAVGVLPITGILLPHAPGGWLAGAFGWTGLDIWCEQLDALLSNPRVGRIVVPIDSPGGAVAGVQEAAAKVLAGRSVKPIEVVASYLAASAAYWIAAQGSKLWVSTSADVASIGVYALHLDISEALKKEGVKPTYIQSTLSPYKTEGSELFPLGKEAKAEAQRRVDAIMKQFLQALEAGRGLSLELVEIYGGKGRLVMAKDAVRGGHLADGIRTANEVITGRSERTTTTMQAFEVEKEYDRAKIRKVQAQLEQERAWVPPGPPPAGDWGQRAPKPTPTRLFTNSR